MHGGNDLIFCMLMYPDHLQNWLDFSPVLLIFPLLASLWHLVKQVEFGVSWHFLENAWREWLAIVSADVYCPPWELIDCSHGLLICLILALFWLSETEQLCGFWAFPVERIEGMVWNFACWCILTIFRSHSSLNSHMMMKWCTKLDVAEKRGPIVFQGHHSNFKVTLLKTLSILTQIGCFQTVTPVWIHQWLRNDAQSLK